MTSRAAGADPWIEFCEQLKRAGSVLGRDVMPEDDLTRAEGYRKLMHLIRMGFEMSLDFADTEHPIVYQVVTSTTLGEGETSDARYHQALIEGSATYHVTGERGTAPLIEFTVYTGKMGIHDSSERVGFLTERELSVREDGSFEVVLSPEEHRGNWIRTTPEARLLYIRQYAHDWSHTRSASFQIRREGVETPAGPIRLEQVQEGLRLTGEFVARSASLWAAIVDRMAEGEPNRFSEVSQAQTAKSPEMPFGHRFSTGYFRIEPDEALLVTFEPAEVPYWGLDLTNYWFEPLSYEDHRSHVNNRTAHTEPDGSVRVVISSQPPGAPNWLDTIGHREGTMVFRWSRTRDPIPALSTRLVKLQELGAGSAGRP